jgi:hypothetical protein
MGAYQLPCLVVTSDDIKNNIEGDLDAKIRGSWGLQVLDPPPEMRGTKEYQKNEIIVQILVHLG